MTKLFSKLNGFLWRGVREQVLTPGNITMQKPRFPTPPASEDVFNMTVEAIRKHSLSSAEEMERTGNFDGIWKHPIEELLYSGAFSDDQQMALQEVFAEVTHNIGVTHAKVLATRMLCGAVDRPKVPRATITTVGQPITPTTYNPNTWK